MRIARWSAVVGAALLLAIPAAAEASTGTSSTQTTTSTQTPTAPSSSTNTSTAPKTSTSPQTTTSKTTTTKSTTQSGTTTQTTPAPGGTAEAYALNLANILALSHTKASASGSGSSATADPLELGGSPPASVFGGTSSNGKASSGSLIDIPPGGSSQFRLAIAPWTTSTTQSPSGSTASAMSDIVLLDLGTPGTAQSASLRVLQSKSDAAWTPAASSGSSSSDGAILNVGGSSGLTVDLLHSESSSSGKGSSYVASINGMPIISSDQVGGQCALHIPSLLDLSCVTASGGLAGTVTSSGGEVLGATALPGTGNLQADLIKSTTVTNNAPVSSSGSGAQTTPPPPPASNGNAPAAAPASGALAFTGLDIGGFVALALALGLGGVGLVWWSRRRTLTA